MMIDNGVIIGFLSIQPNPDWLWIAEVFVSPSHRRCGVATKLIEHVKLRYKQIDPKATLGVCGAVDPANTASRTLLRHLSFAHTYTFDTDKSLLFTWFGRDE